MGIGYFIWALGAAVIMIPDPSMKLFVYGVIYERDNF